MESDSEARPATGAISMSNLVSLYVPAGGSLQAARNLIKRELASAKNVKDSWTRQEVQGALSSLLAYLRDLKKVPANGLVLFASSNNIEALEPPAPNRASIYRCGSSFYRVPLEALYDEAAGPKTGLILLDTNEATVAWFRGETFVALWHDFSGVMGKHSRGGMSSARFERGHEEQRKEWWRKVVDIANRAFLSLGIANVLVGGPGFIKADMLKDHVLDHRLMVIGTVDCEYVDDVAGPREALARWRQST